MFLKVKFNSAARASAIFTLVAVAGILPAAAQEAGEQPWMVVMSPTNSFNYTLYKDRKMVAQLGTTGWGPNWAWRSIGTRARAANHEINASAPFESNKATGDIINLSLNARQTEPNTLCFRLTLDADKDVPLSSLVTYLNMDPAFREGEAVVTPSNGQAQKWPLSFSLGKSATDVEKVDFQPVDGGEFELTCTPPQNIGTDRGLRVQLAQGTYPAGTKTVTLALKFPQPVAFLASDEDIARFTKPLAGPDWFPFSTHHDLGPSALGFEDWLDKPAGKHGGVRQVGDHFEFEDKTPVKFWGTNLGYAQVAPNQIDADFTAGRFAKWGVNAVRLHKFQGAGWAGIGDPNDATKTAEKGQDRFDYFTSALKKNGIYFGFSHTFQFEVRPGNRDRLLAYDEIKDKLKGNTYAFINIAEDVQDLMIEWTVNLLKHRNPYTGLAYAEDPALAYIELQNEDDIFFYTTENALNACPTYKKRFIERYNEWLTRKYGTTAGLKAAWAGALKNDESLEARDVGLEGNPWFFGSDHLPTVTGPARVRLLDNAAFFDYCQTSFYTRFAKAIREAGYQGPLVGSCWQAPAMLPHYYNLKSDAAVGYVDRHNYFGGKLNDSMLSVQGSGYLSTGLQQVAGRPFGVSEWIHVYPSFYSAEGPPLMAAYGLGLQGWDASYEFASTTSSRAFTPNVGSPPWGVWNVDQPNQLGQFPLLARMIARGDVKEGEIIATRRVSPQDLAGGTFNFTETAEQQGDVKTFGGSVPAKALAAGRCLVDFTAAPAESTLPDMKRYEQGSTVRSNTGQLLWDGANGGYFTIDTAGTKGLVGFAGVRNASLGDIGLKLDCPYASLLITAAEKDKDLSTAKRALVSLFARNCNAGFSYFDLDKRIINNGEDKVLLEPAKANLTFKRQIAAVNILDQDSKPTGATLPAVNGAIELDTGRDKTPYYEVVFADK